jgi:hypothetical protein
MEPGDHLVVEHWPGPGQASGAHGGAQLCSRNWRAAHARKAEFTRQLPRGGEANVYSMLHIIITSNIYYYYLLADLAGMADPVRVPRLPTAPNKKIQNDNIYIYI